jgi:hypothetical protein
MRPRSRVVVLGLLVFLCTALLARSAVAAETMLYDVTSVEFRAFTAPVLSSSGPVRVEIIDNGPGTPEGEPRWRSSGSFLNTSLLVWDIAPADLSAELYAFGNHCADIGRVMPQGAAARTVQDALGGGYFAWIGGSQPPDGAPDPYAFFCLKASHQSTTTWSERILIGRRVYTTQPPPPPPSTLKVFITQPRNAATVGGTVWVVMWVEGTTGSSNTFTLSADGKQVGTQTTSSRGPVTLPWATMPAGAPPIPNGTHTLTGTVRDAAGNTGTTSITVIVNNN